MNLKILFVSSGNSRAGISPIVRRQGESLLSAGIEVSYFTIKGKGIRGYTKNILTFRRFIKSNDFQVIHSHYSFSGYVTSLAFPAIPNIVSLMGSDVNKGKLINFLNKFFAFFFWDTVIVKSKDMHDKFGYKKARIIPNGVDINLFHPEERETARNRLKLEKNRLLILFGSNPDRPEKNFSLAEKALRGIEKHRLIFLKDIPSDSVPDFLNACDLLILSSAYEGSPNIIKEAMACSRPIVSTDVGDVRWIIGDTEGCYIADFTVADFSAKIKLALDFSKKYGKTKGRERIKKLGLDSESIASQLKNIYLSYIP